MEIILVVHDKKGKNVLFVLDNLRALTLKEAISQTRKGKISGAHLVEAPKGIYLRANPNATGEDNLDAISIPLSAVTKISMREPTSAVRKYSRRRQQFLKEWEETGGKVIYIDGKRKETEKAAIEYLTIYRKEILAAAKDLKADKYLLGAILIDEYLRKDWIDNWFDWMAILGCNRSVGIAQVKIETARDLIGRGFYPADPATQVISPKNANKIPNRFLHDYLGDAKHSIYMVAAKINQIKKDFASRYEVTRREVVADLYARKDLESTKGKITARGKQKATEFYAIAKKALK